MAVTTVQLTLTAGPWVGEGVNEEQQDVQPGSRWQVRVQRDDSSDVRIFQLSDPFDTQQNAECRWYLDQFVQRSPYSVTRAAKQVEALDQYAKSIVRQLRLNNFLEEIVNNNPLSNLRVCLVIAGHSDHDMTIHRLHWELLEDPNLWQPLNVQMAVTRLGVSKYPSRQLPNRNNEVVAASNSCNLLLVVSRNLSMPDRYDDVDPALATKILTNIYDQTRAKHHLVTLNVEIVRPGTRQALEQHLQRARNTHGPSHFEIIHFDLHGEVDRKEQKAYLLFNSEDGSLQRESAQEIAELMKEHCIRSVVFNACESARADCGTKANIAQIFQQNGVQNLVAMTHKISSTAAEVYMNAFYHDLIVKRLNFSVAAHNARDVLREISERDARFGLRRSLLDYHVPVTYISSLQPGGIFDSSSDYAAVGKDNNRANAIFDRSNTNDLYGRGFDLLKLEKLLQERRCVLMSGPVGVGKTALLHEARRLWLKTKFIDILCMVDFSRANFTNSGEFMASLVAQLPFGESERRDLTDQMNEVVSKSSLDISELVAVFLRAVPGYRCVFIFDGLHVVYTAWGEKMLGFPGRDLMSRIASFIEALVKQTRATQYMDNVYLILAVRVPILPDRFKAFIPHDFEDISFPLRSLQMSDYISLAQAILRRDGHPDQEWTNAELNDLELALDLLQGLPGAAWQILPAVVATNIPRKQIRQFLHSGLSEATPALQKHEFFRQLLHLSTTIKDGLFASLLILTLYWHEGPGLDDFVTIIISSGVHDDDDALTNILSLSFDQGYITFTPDRESTIIHPLFSIYGRLLANSICKNSITKLQGFSNSMIGRASRWLSSLVTPVTEKQELAAVLVTGVRTADLQNVPVHMLESVEGLRSRFIDSIANKSMSRWVSNHCQGTDLTKILSRWNSDLANLQTCIENCLSTPAIHTKHWPLLFFQQQAAGIRMYGTIAQINLYAAQLGRIFDRFIELNGSYALQSEHQLFGLSMSSCLAAAYNSELRNLKRFEYFVECGMKIITESEAVCGPFVSFESIYMKGLLMRYKALHFLEQGSQLEAEQIWQSMLDLEESLWDTDNSKSVPAFSKAEADALVANFSTGSEDLETVRSHVHAIADRSVPQAFYKSRKQSLQLIKMIGERKRQGEMYEKSREYKTVMLQTGLGMEGILDAVESTGVQNLDSDTRWWPENLDMLKHVRRYRNPRNRLDDLEEAQSSGNAFAAMEHHQALLREAITQMDLDETSEHANALERIYQHDPAFGEHLQGLQRSKMMFKSLKDVLQVAKNPVGDAGKTMLDAFKNHHDVLIRAGVPQEAVDAFGVNVEILTKDRELYGDESVTSTGVNKDFGKTMVSNMQRLMANIENPDFMKEFPKISLALMNLLREIQEAESAQDLEAEWEAFNKYEELSKLPIAKDIVDQSWIEARRREINRKTMWKPYLDGWAEAMDSLDFERARTCVEGMEKEPDKWSSAWASEKLLDLHETTEKVQWDTLTGRAISVMSRGEYEEACNDWDKLYNLHVRGKFSHLPVQNDSAAFYGMRTNQLLSHINIAVRSAKWDEALNLCNKWFDFTKDRHEEDITTKRNDFLDLKEACEIQIHSREYQSAVEETRTADAMTHLMALYALAERQSQTPDLKRNLAVVLSKEMLNQWQRRILMVRLAQSFRSLGLESASDDAAADQESVPVKIGSGIQEHTGT